VSFARGSPLSLKHLEPSSREQVAQADRRDAQKHEHHKPLKSRSLSRTQSGRLRGILFFAAARRENSAAARSPIVRDHHLENAKRREQENAPNYILQIAVHGLASQAIRIARI
jgi:hypothetical protein